MNPPVLFFQREIIFDEIILGIDPPSEFIGDAKEFSPVKTIVIEKEPKRDRLQYQENKKREIPANEQKYITHGAYLITKGYLS